MSLMFHVLLPNVLSKEWSIKKISLIRRWLKKILLNNTTKDKFFSDFFYMNQIIKRKYVLVAN